MVIMEYKLILAVGDQIFRSYTVPIACVQSTVIETYLKEIKENRILVTGNPNARKHKSYPKFHKLF
jgi:hypothetical protein